MGERTVVVLNGPNLNLLGEREPEVYGHETLADVEALCGQAAADAGLGLDFRQSNHEGVLVDAIHEVRASAAGIVINAGALTHTQGGLEVNTEMRVLRKDGTPFPNLFAGGGAARGLSGPSDWGYLSGSGLMAATNMGRLAGIAAAKLVKGQR